MNRTSGRLIFGLAGIFVALTLAGSAMADAAALAGRLPRSTNTVMLIDATKLMATPLASSQNWQSKLITGYADRPFALPPTAQQVAMGAFIHPAKFESIWQAAVISLPNPPRLETMLDKQGGFYDRVANKKAVWTSKDSYYVELDTNMLGICRPGDRQFAGHWAGATGDAKLSDYLTAAIKGSGDAPVFFAMDLTGSVGPGAMAYAFRMGSLPSLEKITDGRDKLMAALGSVKGLKLSMNVTSQIDATLTVEFDQDVAALGENTKAFVVDVLTAADLIDGQMDNWQFTASGKSIIGKGVSTNDAIGRLMAVLSPGDMGAAAPAPEAKAGTDSNAGGAAAPASPAAASQAYYRSVSKTLDQMTAQNSPTQSAKWLIARGKQIQQLPILGVDTELLQWGSALVDAFNQTAQVLAVGQQQAQAAAENVASPTASGNVNWNGEQTSSDDAASRAAFRNAQSQRRAAAQAQRAQAANSAADILSKALQTRAQIRASMVQKYNVEF